MFSIIIGIVLLYIGAESLVRGSSRLAAQFGIPPLIIGLTVVAFGTSSPELLVSISAALKGASDVGPPQIPDRETGEEAAEVGLPGDVRVDEGDHRVDQTSQCSHRPDQTRNPHTDCRITAGVLADFYRSSYTYRRNDPLPMLMRLLWLFHSGSQAASKGRGI